MISKSQRDIALFADIFTLEREVAISIAIRETIVASGGLTRLTAVLRQHPLHPAFEGATKDLIDELETEGLVGEISQPRNSGDVQSALNAMCLRSNIDPADLSTLVRDGFIAPVVFASGYRDMLMVNGDLTVYGQTP